jgi:SAM-dependent methyltransferase
MWCSIIRGPKWGTKRELECWRPDLTGGYPRRHPPRLRMTSPVAAPKAACPSCGSDTIRSLGTPRVIASQGLDSRPSAVCRCATCDLLFFVPVTPKASLLDHYEALAEDRWRGERRPDWALVREAILARIWSGRVLDVGCWSGEFLASLPSGLEKYGIEPSSWAQENARARGVCIVGGSLEDTAQLRATYEVVSMIDVIEHIDSPFEALALASDRVANGGLLVVSTGNSRALPWRLMPLDYWYYYGEHVCFFSERWFRWAAARTALTVEEVGHFSHYPTAHRGTAVAELGRACAFRLLGQDQGLPGRVARRAGLLKGPVETFHWRDHILVVLRKSGEGRRHGRR